MVERRFSRRIALLGLALAALAALFSGGAHAMPDAESEGWLVAALRVEGQFDLYAMPATGGMWQQLTDTPDDERWPSWSADGSQIVYSARRDRNWDLYRLEIATGEETRLTTDPHFDGYPALSPDGTQLAFSATRAGDLDIWLQPVEGTDEAINLTEASTAFDFAPIWIDDSRLLYTSTAERSHDLYQLTLRGDGATSRALTATRDVDERTPQRLAEGEWLVQAISDNGRDLQRLGADGTPLGNAFSMTSGVVSLAVSPSGDEMAWVERRWDGDTLYRSTAGEIDDAVRLFGPQGMIEELAWGLPDGDEFDALLGARYEAPRLAYTPTARELVNVDDMEAPDPALNDAVLEPYQRLRARVLDETGIDFLDTVSETVRPLDYATGESDYLSWHKAGRALDTLLYISSPDGGINRGYLLVRDDWHGDVYWRILIRCPIQDGSCGQPLVLAPWEYEAAESAEDEGAGGSKGLYTKGYYVDFTQMAWDEGWERIASYQIEDFDWRETLYAMEYWHYQRTDGMTWYPAMQELYDQERLDAVFAWDILQERKVEPWILRAKGLPLPLEQRYQALRWAVP